METLTLMLRLYELLDANSEDDLMRAAKVSGYETCLGRALMLLAEYRKEHGSDSNRATQRSLFEHELSVGTVGLRRGKVRSKVPGEKAPKESEAGVNFERKLRDLVQSKKYFDRVIDLVKYVQSCDIPVNLSPRMSRERIYSKIKTALGKLDSETRNLWAKRLFEILQKSETSRWFNVIQREK